MIKGALIFGAGLTIGGLLGLIEGFSLAKGIERAAIDRVTTNIAA
jgi:hypothetical protein